MSTAGKRNSVANNKAAKGNKTKPTSRRAGGSAKPGTVGPKTSAPKRSPKTASSRAKPKRTVAGGKPRSLKAGKAQEKKERRSAALKLFKRTKTNTPAVFKLPSKKNTPIVFSLEEVREVLRSRKGEGNKAVEKKPAPAREPKSVIAQGTIKDETTTAESRVIGAASLADILGVEPGLGVKKSGLPKKKPIPRRFQKYHKLLLELRKQVKAGLEMRSKDTLKRSSKEDSGDLSNYSQHMADAGTDSSDRDFALSLLSNEQEALAEIEVAISRIHDGTYGICEVTGKPIAHERLKAVPFTRYSLEGQAQFEGSSHKRLQRRGPFPDFSVEKSAQFTADDSD